MALTTVRDLESRATFIVDRLSARQRHALAVKAVALSLAEDVSLGDQGYRDRVHGVIRGLAPTLATMLKSTIRQARSRPDEPVPGS